MHIPVATTLCPLLLHCSPYLFFIVLCLPLFYSPHCSLYLSPHSCPGDIWTGSQAQWQIWSVPMHCCSLLKIYVFQLQMPLYDVNTQYHVHMVLLDSSLFTLFILPSTHTMSPPSVSYSLISSIYCILLWWVWYKLSVAYCLESLNSKSSAIVTNLLNLPCYVAYMSRQSLQASLCLNNTCYWTSQEFSMHQLGRQFCWELCICTHWKQWWDFTGWQWWEWWGWWWVPCPLILMTVLTTVKITL